MKCIFKIEKYLPETNQMVVRFARLYSPQHIDEYKASAIDTTRLDFDSYETFVKSLMRNYGDRGSYNSEMNDPIVNDIEEVNINKEFEIGDLMGKIIGCDSDDYKKEIIKMNRVEL